MAGEAGRGEAEVSPLFLFDLRVFDELFLMAVRTFLFCMGTLQCIAGECMIKGFGIESYHFKIPAVVVAVAFDAVFPFHFRRGVVAFALVHPAFQFLVAGEALFVRNFFPQHMAFGTVGHAFEVGMDF